MLKTITKSFFIAIIIVLPVFADDTLSAFHQQAVQELKQAGVKLLLHSHVTEVHISKDQIVELLIQGNEKILKLWEEKTLEAITKEEIDAINKLKEINSVVSDNLYMSQLMSIIQSIREITGRALIYKMKNAES